MKYLTAEQIADKAKHLDGRRNTAEINRLYRLQDESHKWPINSRFNATEKAICRVRRFNRMAGYQSLGLE